MGLDGISINQLRISQELNSKDLNKLNSDLNPQIIDGLAKGQRINSDEKKEKDHAQQQTNEDDDSQDENQEDSQDDNQQGLSYDIANNNPEEFAKYDLSDSKKYVLEVNNNTNTISIIEKSSNKVIQSFNPESLSNLTKYLKNCTGVLFNRKY